MNSSLSVTNNFITCYYTLLDMTNVIQLDVQTQLYICPACYTPGEGPQ